MKKENTTHTHTHTHTHKAPTTIISLISKKCVHVQVCVCVCVCVCIVCVCVCKITYSNEKKRQTNVEVPQQPGKEPPNTTGVIGSNPQHTTFHLSINAIVLLQLQDAVNKELVLLVWPVTRRKTKDTNN